MCTNIRTQTPMKAHSLRYPISTIQPRKIATTPNCQVQLVIRMWPDSHKDYCKEVEWSFHPLHPVAQIVQEILSLNNSHASFMTSSRVAMVLAKLELCLNVVKPIQVQRNVDQKTHKFHYSQQTYHHKHSFHVLVHLQQRHL